MIILLSRSGGETVTRVRILLKPSVCGMQYLSGVYFTWWFISSGRQLHIQSVLFDCSLCTTLCLQWEPEIITIALMHLSCRLQKFEVSDWLNKAPGYKGKWWDQFVEDVSIELLECKYDHIWGKCLSFVCTMTLYMPSLSFRRGSLTFSSVGEIQKIQEKNNLSKFSGIIKSYAHTFTCYHCKYYQRNWWKTQFKLPAEPTSGRDPSYEVRSFLLLKGLYHGHVFTRFPIAHPVQMEA